MSSEHEIVPSTIECGAVVFDWDGTLVDSYEFKAGLVGRVFAERFGCDAQDASQGFRRYSGVPRRMVFEAIAHDLNTGELDDALYNELSGRFSQLINESLDERCVFDDSASTLVYLREHGFRLFVSSSVPPDDLKHAVRLTGLAVHFEEVLGSAPGFGKGPKHIEHICSVSGLAADQICMVGDDEADVRLARQAGAKIVARAGTIDRQRLRLLEPDAVIDRVRELPNLLTLVE